MRWNHRVRPEAVEENFKLGVALRSEVLGARAEPVPAMSCLCGPVALTSSAVLDLPFGHLLTASSERDAHRLGTSIWTASVSAEQRVSLAFDWAEVCDQVVALADLFRVTSNLRPVDEEGRQLGDDRRLQLLVAAIHRLNWQEVVREHFRSRSGQLPDRNVPDFDSFK